MNNKKNIILTILFVSGICLIIFGFLFLSVNKVYNTTSPKNSGVSLKCQRQIARLMEVLPTNAGSPFYLTYHKPNFYFVYKDKFYYYDYKSNSFYSMNMDCSDKNIITVDCEMKHPSFYLVYKDEAYFYNIEGYHNEIDKVNMKVNLLTGEITNLNNDYKVLPVTYNDGVVMTIGNLNLSDSSTFRKYNLNTNNVDFENNYKYMPSYQYMYDYNTGDNYGMNYRLEGTTVYLDINKNNTLFSNFKVDNVYIRRKYGFIIRFLYVDSNIIYFSDTSSLYKYDFKTQAIEKNENIVFDSFDIFYSNNNNIIYFYSRNDCYLYSLDKNDNVIKKLFKVPKAKEHTDDIMSSETVFTESSIYDTGSKIILPFDANNLRYKIKNDESLGQVIIYDKSSKEIETIENVRRAFFDYENAMLYIFIKDKNIYNIKEIPLSS